MLTRQGVRPTAGALCQAAQSASAALAPVQAQTAARLNASAMVVSDETGWHVGGNRTWSGAVTQGRVMSVIRTASQQGVDIIQYLSGVARAPTPEDLPPLFS